MGEQYGEVCKGLVYVLTALHCESMLLYVLQDLDMCLSLPFLSQLHDGKFSDSHSNDASPLQPKTKDTGKKLL